MPDVSDDLVFDLGFHHGNDTRFYLLKGFRVVAVEANPQMCETGRSEFSAEVESGHLVLLERAFWESTGERVSFFINPEKDDWSSVSRDKAERAGTPSVEVQAETVNLEHLFDAYGIPHYLKCDLEGGDEQFVEQLTELNARPDFVSVEALHPRLAISLAVAGYDRFQLVNQALHPTTTPPEPAREGRHVEFRFGPHTSGLFGRELPAGQWLDLDECLARFRAFRELKERDPQLAHGWLDFHARHARLASR